MRVSLFVMLHKSLAATIVITVMCHTHASFLGNKKVDMSISSGVFVALVYFVLGWGGVGAGFIC